MQKYLSNLALTLLNDKAKELNLHSKKHGSYMDKEPRKQHYLLIENKTERIILGVRFHTNQVPTFIIPQ